ncbi:MAG TPA: LuxR C-terminal-related transcriptional regulator [Vicinamibacterales bacterium]|nr:LuxR C-terminal-related transcriptional regulator [Vicinamibacterales bacterium]
MQVLHITPWERGVLEQLASGAATTDIARRLGVNDREIESSLATLFARMGVASRAEAVAVASRRGLLAA